MGICFLVEQMLRALFHNLSTLLNVIKIVLKLSFLIVIQSLFPEQNLFVECVPGFKAHLLLQLKN